MDRAMFRKAVQWLGMIILAHLAAMLIFGLFMASSVTAVAKDDPQYAYKTVIIFDIIFYAVFILLVNRLETSYSDYYRNLKNAIKGEGFRIVSYYKSNFLKEHIIRSALLLAFHIPFAIFYKLMGLSLTATTGFEKFYILDAGFYGAAGSSLLGLLLEALILTALLFAVNIISILIAYYNQKRTISEFTHH